MHQNPWKGKQCRQWMDGWMDFPLNCMTWVERFGYPLMIFAGI